jgi:hypothetical protein
MNAFVILSEARTSQPELRIPNVYRVINPLEGDPSPSSRFGMTAL